MKKSVILTALISASIASSAFAHTHFVQSDLDKLNLTNVCEKCDLSGIQWSNVPPFYPHYPRGNYSQANLTGANLSSDQFTTVSDFSHIQAVGADFSNSYLYDVNFAGANLKDVNFSKSLVYSANFNYADLSGANFNNIHPEGLSLSFENANLTGATFTGSQLEGADFYGATGLNLHGAAWVCGGVKPDGTKQTPCNLSMHRYARR